MKQILDLRPFASGFQDEVEALSFAVGFGEARYRSISSDGPPWKETFQPSADLGVGGK